MTKLLALLLVSIAGISYANACEKWEYAKLKDSTKKELMDEYCYVNDIAQSNKKIWEVRRTMEDASAAKEARQDYFSCLAQQQNVSDMLAKKYKVKGDPICKKN